LKGKILFTVLALICVVSLLAVGCSPKTTPTQTTSAPAPAITTAPQPAPTAATTAPKPSATTAAPTATPAQAAKAIKWVGQCQTASGDTQNEYQHKLINYINTIAAGRLTMDLKDGGAIVPMGKELDGIIASSYDYCMTPYAFTNYLFKPAEIFGVLAAGLTPHQLMSWYIAGGGDELAKKMYASAGKGIYHIQTYGILTSEIWAHSNKELKSLADIKGLKIRAAGAQGEILKQMGAAVVFMPGGELYEAAKRGTIDAFEYDSPSPNYKMGFQEVAKYVYMGANRAPAADGAMFTTDKNWASLPDDLKTLLIEACRALQPEYLANLIKQDAENLQKFKDYGVIVAPIPADIDAELLKLAPLYYQKTAAEDPLYKEIYESTLKWKAICEEQGYR